MNKRERIVHIKRNDKWLSSHFSEIKQGDIFRMFESDNGDKVVDAKGRSEFVAFSNARINEDGQWAVDVGC